MREYEVRFPDGYRKEFDFINLLQAIQRFVIESEISLPLDYLKRRKFGKCHDGEYSKWDREGLE